MTAPLREAANDIVRLLSVVANVDTKTKLDEDEMATTYSNSLPVGYRAVPTVQRLVRNRVRYKPVTDDDTPANDDDDDDENDDNDGAEDDIDEDTQPLDKTLSTPHKHASVATVVRQQRAQRQGRAWRLDPCVAVPRARRPATLPSAHDDVGTLVRAFLVNNSPSKPSKRGKILTKVFYKKRKNSKIYVYSFKIKRICARIIARTNVFVWFDCIAVE